MAKIFKLLFKPFVWLDQLFCEHPYSCEKSIIKDGELTILCGLCGKELE